MAKTIKLKNCTITIAGPDDDLYTQGLQMGGIKICSKGKKEKKPKKKK